MKKSLLLMLVVVVMGFSTTAKADPLPDCANSAMINAIVNAQAAQGWILSNTDFQPIFYIVQPTPPYLAGTATLSFVPDCAPGDPCPRIAKVLLLNVTVVNNNGTCLYSKVNNGN